MAISEQSLIAPLRLAVVDGTAAPGVPEGARVQSSVLRNLMVVRGGRWRVAHVPASINRVPDDEVVVIPVDHNLLLFGPLAADGLLVADGNVIELN